MRDPRFEGSWRLRSWLSESEDGDVIHPMGKRPHGLLHYHPGGRMSVLIAAGDRAPIEGGDLFARSVTEKPTGFESFIAYAGTYQTGDGTVTHHVEISSFPNWEGTAQKRYARLTDDTLTLNGTTKGGAAIGESRPPERRRDGSRRRASGPCLGSKLRAVASSSMTTSSMLRSAIGQLLAEGFEGASAGSTWFIDDQGLLGTVASLDADRASQPTTPGGTTVAAHAEHVRWFVGLLNAYARGESPEIRWAESWAARKVDEASWAHLQNELETEFRDLATHLERGLELDDPERLTPVLATVVHVGYHLGAIRQMVKLV